MMKSWNKFGLVFLLLIGIAMAGCGGGGGSKSTTSPVYQAVGTGIITQAKNEIEGQSFMESLLPISLNPTLKKINLTVDGFKSQTFRASSGTPAVEQKFLEENDASIVLTWEPVNGAERYQVFYGEQKVWDSKDPHPNDPDNGGTEIAYLDLDEELSKEKLGDAFIDEPGEYEFRVYALKSNTNDTVIYQFSTVTASLGMILGSFPTEILYNSSTQQLTWKEVEEANGYRVEIYDKADYTNRVFDTGETLLPATSCDLTGASLVDGKTYFFVVNAYAVDGSGHPLEITRGIQD